MQRFLLHLMVKLHQLQLHLHQTELLQVLQQQQQQMQVMMYMFQVLQQELGQQILSDASQFFRDP